MGGEDCPEAGGRAPAAVAGQPLRLVAEGIVGLRESVADKRAEAEKIKRDQRLCSIVGGQDVSLQELSEERTHYLVKCSIGCPCKKDCCGGSVSLPLLHQQSGDPYAKVQKSYFVYMSCYWQWTDCLCRVRREKNAHIQTQTTSSRRLEHPTD